MIFWKACEGGTGGLGRLYLYLLVPWKFAGEIPEISEPLQGLTLRVVPWKFAQEIPRLLRPSFNLVRPYRSIRTL